MFYNLTATGNSAETVTLAGAESVTNNFAISAGTFDCQTYQLTGNATGTFTMAAGSSLLIGVTASATAVAFPTNFTTANITLDPASTVTYHANTAQTVSNTPTYGNLIIGTGATATTKTPGGTPMAIAGNLTINASSTLSETTNTINLTGNLTNNGTLSFSTGALNIGGNFTNNLTFTAGTSTVTFDGTANEAINGTVAAETFYNVIVNLTAGQTLGTGGSTVTVTTNNLTITTGNFTAPATLNINGTLTLTAGTLTAGTTINIMGNWTNNGGTFTPGTNLVKFVGTSGEVINGTAAAQTFYNVTVNMTAGQTLSTGGSTVTVTTNNLTETTGNFTAPATLNINGSVTLTAGTFTAGTTINVMGSRSATVAAAAAFVPGGNTVNFVGTAGETINGTAAAQTFSNVVVNLTAGQTLNTGGSTVTLTTTNLTMTTGNFTAPATLNVNGNLTLTAGTLTAGTTINIQGNWTNNGGTFTPGLNLVKFVGTSGEVINGTAAAQTFYNVTVNLTAGQTLSTGGSTVTVTTNNLTETTGNFTAPATLNINGSVTLTAGTFTAGTTINVMGSWSATVAAAAAFVPGGNTVNFVGTAGETINGTAAAQTFSNVVVNLTAGQTLNTGGSTVTLTTTNLTMTTGNFTAPATLNVNGNLTLTAGTLTAGTTINIQGNWTNNGGTFTPGLNLVKFVGTSGEVINGTAAAQTFYNVTVNLTAGQTLSTGGSTVTVTTNNLTETTGNFTAPATLNINGILTLTAGTLTAGTNININGNWTNNGGTFTSNSGTVSFNGTAGQTIGGTASTSFYNLTATGNSSETVTLGIAQTITNNFAINAGTFDCQKYQITGNATGTLTMAAGTFLLVGATGAATAVLFPTNFTAGNITLNVTSTVTYQANLAQTVSTVPTYGNLIIGTGAAATTKTPGGTPLAIAGNLTVNASSTLGQTTNTINLSGNLTNNGVLSFTTGALNIGGNFTNNLTFTAGTGTVTFNGAAAQSIGGVTTSFYGLNINNSSGMSTGVSQSVNTNVTNQLILTAGAYNLNGFTLTVSNAGNTNAAISGGSATAYIVSENTSMNSILDWHNISKTVSSFNFPFGCTVGASNYYIPFTFNITTAAGVLGDVSLATYHTGSGNTPLAPGVTALDAAGTTCGNTGGTDESVAAVVDRWWQITAATSPTATITFTYAGPEAATVTDATENGGTCSGNVTIQHWNTGITNWDPPVGTPAALVVTTGSTGSVSASGISTFSPWVLSLSSTPLPIKLLNFDAVYNTSDKDVNISWKTASEINNKLFTVERSTDGINFEEIATQPGAGTSTSVHSYSTIDPTPVAGIDYYRLKQTDIDGNFTYSDVVPVNITASEDFTLFPNPVSSIVNMSCYSGTNCSATIVVCDVTGKEVANFSQEIQKGGNTINLNVEAFTSGVYVVKAQVGSATYVKKFLKL